MSGSHEHVNATEVIELESLDTSFAVRPDQEATARRRLMTLLAERTPSTSLGQGEVLRAHNTAGELFALKRLRTLPADADPFVRRGREAALFEEYRSQLAVSRLKGFPRLYGYGITRTHEPVILMEWVEGVTLIDAIALLPDGAQRGVAVAAVAASVLSALVSASRLEGSFVHRDISPRNVILRGTTEGVSQGLAQGHADACLIDFGSAIFIRRDEASFTATEDIWRNGTPEYTPPEMLAPHDRSSYDQRRNPAIDVYATCSMLYELYSGSTPFSLADHPDENTYELKTTTEPAALVPQDERDRPLCEAIMSGIRVAPEERPRAAVLLGVVQDWLSSQGVEPEDSAATFGRTPEADSGSTHLHIGDHASRLTSEVAGGAAMVATLGSAVADGAGFGAAGAGDAGDVTGGASAVVGSAGRASAAVAGGATGAGAAGGVAGSAGGTAGGTDDRHEAAITPLARPGIRRTAPSRRTFLKLAGGVAGLAVLGGIGVATRGFGLLGPRDFAALSWSELSDIAQDISSATSEDEARDAARTHGLLTDAGDLRNDLVKGFKLADGTDMSAQVIGFYHDDRSDDHGKAGLTFAFTQPFAERPMAEAPMASGGWETCDARAWISANLLNALPSDLTNAIVAVDKMTNNEGSTRVASSVTATSDLLWLFSMVELGGPRDISMYKEDYRYLADILNNEGSQYLLYQQEHFSSRGSNAGLVRDFDGDTCYWWTRTPSPDVSENMGATNFNRVGTDGDPFHHAAPATGDGTDDNTAPDCLLPGFCL